MEKFSGLANNLENRIIVKRIKHFDAHNHRINRIERFSETAMLENEISILGLFDPDRFTYLLLIKNKLLVN